jgi:hypothetical protein
VSDLHVTSVGVTQARLTWSNANGTASYRMLIEELTTHSSVNISGLKPGTNNSFAFPESNETQADFAVAEEVPGELQNCVSGFDFYHLLLLNSTMHCICIIHMHNTYKYAMYLCRVLELLAGFPAEVLSDLIP